MQTSTIGPKFGIKILKRDFKHFFFSQIVLHYLQGHIEILNFVWAINHIKIYQLLQNVDNFLLLEIINEISVILNHKDICVKPEQVTSIFINLKLNTIDVVLL